MTELRPVDAMELILMFKMNAEKNQIQNQPYF